MKCIICNKEKKDIHFKQRDYITGLLFCCEHYSDAEKRFFERYQEKGVSGWLRAIADTREKYEGKREI